MLWKRAAAEVRPRGRDLVYTEHVQRQRATEQAHFEKELEAAAAEALAATDRMEAARREMEERSGADEHSE